MQDRDRNNEMFEAILKVAGKEALERELEKIPPSEELDKIYKPSREYEKKLKKIISQSTRKDKFNIFIKRFKKVAIAAVIGLIALSAVLLTVEASRNYIFNTIIKWYDQYTYVELGDSSPYITITDMPRPTYIPEGFTEVQSNLVGDMKFLIYQDSDGEKILYEEYLKESFGTLVDNEHKLFIATEINGNVAHLFDSRSEGNNILFWKYNDSVLKLMSKINVDEIIKIAESVE